MPKKHAKVYFFGLQLFFLVYPEPKAFLAGHSPIPPGFRHTEPTLTPSVIQLRLNCYKFRLLLAFLFEKPLNNKRKVDRLPAETCQLILSNQYWKDISSLLQVILNANMISVKSLPDSANRRLSISGTPCAGCSGTRSCCLKMVFDNHCDSETVP